MRIENSVTRVTVICVTEFPVRTEETFNMGSFSCIHFLYKLYLNFRFMEIPVRYARIHFPVQLTELGTNGDLCHVFILALCIGE